MHRLLAADLAAQELDGPVGDDLIQVHVGLGAGARLPDGERKLARPFAGDHFLGGTFDGIGQIGLEHAEFPVGAGRAQFQYCERLDQRRRHFFAADSEILTRSLGLGTPEMIRWDGDVSKAVFLDAGGGRLLGHGRTPSGKGSQQVLSTICKNSRLV